MEKIKMGKLLLAFSVALVVTGATNAGVGPVSNLPDYNGTYWGTPNTGGDCDAGPLICDSLAGRKMFTTLYRDNYDRTAGCAGEGCGKHPGVDIDVESGTPVRASLAGTVVEADCDWNGVRGFNNGAAGFGGLAVLKADNPYGSGYVYLSYAHLDNWSIVSVNQTVSVGQTIGYSGGSPQNGNCPGASDGTHLHFQVDKNAPTLNSRNVLTPWFPTGQVNQADTNFQVPQYTHNPLPFVLGYAYNFTFAENNNAELWGAAAVNSYGVSNSELWLDGESSSVTTGRSADFGNVSCGQSASCTRRVTLDADIFRTLKLNIQFDCFNNPVIIRFKKTNGSWYAGGINYSVAATYTVDMSSLSTWNGLVTDLKIEPSVAGCSGNPGPKEFFFRQVYFLP